MKSDLFIHYGGYIFSAIGAMAGVAVLSYIVAPQHYGSLALYIAIATLFQYIVRESLANAILRYAKSIQQNKRSLLTLAKQSSRTLACCYLAICFFTYTWAPTNSAAELLLSFILILALGLAVIGESFLSALLDRKSCVIHINIIQWLRFPLAGLCYALIDQDVNSLLFGFVLAFALAFSFDALSWRKLKQKSHQPSAKQFSIFLGSAPLWIGALTWFMAFYDRIILEKLHGQELLGNYFVLLQVSYMPIMMLLRSTSNYLFPLLFTQQSVLNKKLCGLVGIATIATVIMLSLLHEWIFSWLVGEHYRSYSWLLPWLFCAAIFQSLAYLLQAKYYQEKSMQQLLGVKLLAAILCFVLMTLLAWHFAIEGLIAAHLIVAIALLCMTLLMSRKKQLPTIS